MGGEGRRGGGKGGFGTTSFTADLFFHCEGSGFHWKMLDTLLFPTLLEQVSQTRTDPEPCAKTSEAAVSITTICCEKESVS